MQVIDIFPKNKNRSLPIKVYGGIALVAPKKCDLIYSAVYFSRPIDVNRIRRFLKDVLSL